MLKIVLFSGIALGTAGNAVGTDNGDRAAVNYVLVSNGGRSCGLRVDMPSLGRALIADGLDRRLFLLGGGRPFTTEDERDARLQRQFAIWGKTLGSLRITPADCQSIYNHFGPRGDVYKGVVAKPPLPYSPYQLR